MNSLLGIGYYRGKLTFNAWAKGREVHPFIGDWLRGKIIDTWNKVACRIVGHDHSLHDIPEERHPDGSYHCSDCCASLYDS